MLAVLPICVKPTVVAACMLILQEPDVYAVATGACMSSKLYRKRCFPVESARPLTLLIAAAEHCHAVHNVSLQQQIWVACLLLALHPWLHWSALSVQGPL